VAAHLVPGGLPVLTGGSRLVQMTVFLAVVPGGVSIKVYILVPIIG